LYASLQSSHTYYQDDSSTALTDEAERPLGWHVLWTRSNSEKLVKEQLVAKDYEVFLPMNDQWSLSGTRARKQPIRRVPMFKGYLFLRHRIDRTAFLDISNTKGLVHILGSRWDRLAQVPDEELASIKRAEESREPLLPYPYLKVGSRVRIIRGTLTNAQGILVRTELAKGLLVISVGLLQRSVAVKVRCADVAPV
jgi:transcription antitermination factor NusG